MGEPSRDHVQCRTRWQALTQVTSNQGFLRLWVTNSGFAHLNFIVYVKPEAFFGMAVADRDFEVAITADQGERFTFSHLPVSAAQGNDGFAPRKLRRAGIGKVLSAKIRDGVSEMIEEQDGALDAVAAAQGVRSRQG